MKLKLSQFWCFFPWDIVSSVIFRPCMVCRSSHRVSVLKNTVQMPIRYQKDHLCKPNSAHIDTSTTSASGLGKMQNVMCTIEVDHIQWRLKLSREKGNANSPQLCLWYVITKNHPKQQPHQQRRIKEALLTCTINCFVINLKNTERTLLIC